MLVVVETITVRAPAGAGDWADTACPSASVTTRNATHIARRIFQPPSPFIMLDRA